MDVERNVDCRQTAYLLIVACGFVNTYRENVVIQYSFFLSVAS